MGETGIEARNPAAGTLVQLAAETAARFGARPAVVSADGRLSWADVVARSHALAAGLARSGVRPADRVVVQIGNNSEFVVTYLGVLHAGAVAVPVNPALTLDELAHVLADSGAVMLVTASVAAAASAEALRSAHPALASVVVAAPRAATGTASLEDLIDPGGDAGAPAAQVSVRPDDLAALVYTSGTSGWPKGAMLTHAALVANLDQVAAVRPPLLDEHDVVAVLVPLFSVYGLNVGLGLALRFGAAVVLGERFEPVESLRTVRQERADIVVGAPAIFQAFAAVPDGLVHLAGVRFALSGSAPLATGLVERYGAAGVALHQGYGLTEAAPVVSTDLADARGTSRVGRPAPGTVGAPLPGVEVAILDEHGDGAAEDGDPGVVRVRGANLFSGYWPDGAGGPDTDGWFTTGDLGLRDPNGDLVLVGRDNDLVLVNGFNVYPAEVERVVSALPRVAEVAVTGQVDERTGQRVVAHVVALPGQDLDVEAVLAGAARSLARFKVPSEVRVVAALPHSGTGKVQKWRLAEGADTATDTAS